MSGYPRWRRARFAVTMLITLAVIVLFLVLIFKNVAPFGASVEYHIDLETGVGDKALPSPLEPSAALGVDENGVAYQVPQSMMTSDLLTFELEIPYENFDTAELTIRYQGDPEEFLFGLRGDKESEYRYKPIHNRSLNELDWFNTEDAGITLWERQEDYASVEEFISDPLVTSSEDGQEAGRALVASYYYEVEQPYPEIDASGIDSGTRVGSLLRGLHVFYTVVGVEPLSFSFDKRELNWKEGPDPLGVFVYSGSELIWSTSIPDDGDEFESGVISPAVEFDLTLPDLPEGVYRIELFCDTDVIIENLRATQGYLSFVDKIFVADHELYEIAPSRPQTVFTNAEALYVWTWHPEAYQTIGVDGEEEIVMEEAGIKTFALLPYGVKELRMEMGDLSFLSKESSFAFSRASFFDPYPVKVKEYSREILYSDIEYVIADYTVPDEEGEWLTRKLTFDLEDMEIEDNKLRCTLWAPNLAVLDGEIVLGSLDIKLQKDGS